MKKERINFLEVFPGLTPLDYCCGGLDRSEIISVKIKEADLAMEILASFPAFPSAADLELVSDTIKAQYGLNSVIISPFFEQKKRENFQKVLFGRLSKAKPVPISGLSIDSGTVSICGKVFGVQSRDIPKRGGRLLSFLMSDKSDSIKVVKYFSKKDDSSVCDKVRDGQYISVRGKVEYSERDEDMIIDPVSIVLVPEPMREDNSEKKRVELNLHTKFSTLDAVTDVEELFKLVSRWGHKAVAVTDSGGCQAFPDMYKMSRKTGVKAIYGMDGYYIDDYLTSRALKGYSDSPIGSELVVFDVETTGLNPTNSRLIEIGAVKLRNGELYEEFLTFVDPETELPPKISELTGISKADLKDAPKEAEALKAFLDFAGSSPLAAHNADFDISFMRAAASRQGTVFEPVYLDTLVLSRKLLPELARHSLDKIAQALNVPDFTHHRASDDAKACALVCAKLLDMLKERGAEKFSDINPVLSKLPGGSYQRPKHISILARNKLGLKNLYKLVSKSYLENFKRYPIITRSSLEERRGGLLIGSGGPGGELFEALLRDAPYAELRAITAFYDYIEIVPVSNFSYLLSDGVLSGEEEQRDIIRKLARLAKDLEKPLCATGEVRFLDPEDEIFRKILLSEKNFPDANEPRPLYMRTSEEMLEEFSFLDERTAFEAVITNPNRIADMCEEIELLPKGLFAPKIENSAEELKSLVFENMRKLYGENPPPIVRERVENELRDILGRGYDVIYMSAQKLVADSNEHGYLVGSRGSVGSSLVAFLSGITEVNALPAHYRCEACSYSDFESAKGYFCGANLPDKNCPNCGAEFKKDGFDIPFETFLGFGGDKVPDIDLNFSGEYQARAHKYTEELFGKEHVFRAGTIGTMASKTAYGYVKNYLEKNGLSAGKAEIERLTTGLVGVKRTTGQHPGGLVIIPQGMDIEDFCPVQHPADDAGSGVITTHFDYHCMEDNLLKLDELGHDDPTMLKMLGDMTGVDVREIRLDDAKTMSLFKGPEVLGLSSDDSIIGKTGSIAIPEFGTSFTKKMLEETKPNGFDTLIRLSGFSHGTDVWRGNAQDIIKNNIASIEETISCRDDIMLYLIEKGMPERQAFKIMENVRKGRGLSAEESKSMRDLNVPLWYIDSCNKIQYLFPKAHAVAYVMMAFRIAYFKVHHPLEFYAAYFYRRSQKDAFDAKLCLGGAEFVKEKVLEIQRNKEASQKDKETATTLEAVYEFYMRGFNFAPLCIYESDAFMFKIVDEKTLLPPLFSISGLGNAATMDIVNCRQERERFTSIEEFASYCPKLSRTNIEQLRQIGALHDLPEENQMSLFDF